MKHFLLPVDGPETADKALAYLLPILEALPESTLTLLTLLTDCPYTDAELAAMQAQAEVNQEVHGAEDHLAQISAAEALQADLAGCLGAEGVAADRLRCELHPVRAGLAEDILAHATRLGCDTVVVVRGESGAMHRMLLGSVTSALVKEAQNLTIWVVC